MLKTVLYLLSWLIKIFGKLLLKLFRERQIVNKAAFFVIYFHNKIHLAVFNTFISSGVFLVTRTMIHMKTIPEDSFHIFDKMIGLLCLILVVADFNDLFFSTTITPPASVTK